MSVVNHDNTATRCPAHVPVELVKDFDYHSDPRFLADPLTGFDAVRDARVFWTNSHGGYWVITGAEDIREAFKHPEYFSSEPQSKADDLSPTRRAGGARRLIPTGIDPPEHGQYRRLLMEPFSPATVNGMKERIVEVCEGLVDGLAPRGRCDFLNEFARPFPTILFTAMLGIPTERAEEFLGWSDDMLHGDPEQAASGGRNVTAYLDHLIDEVVERPRDDLVSFLVQGTVDGRPTTKQEVLDTCHLLFLAGLDTVATALVFIFKHLAEHPDDRQRLVADSAAIPAAVEELLRLNSFVNPSRTVAQDVEFAGVAMKKGDHVLLSTALGSRDPELVPDAAVAVLNRRHNPHMAFGVGPHRCLGAHLARAELTTALSTWIAHIPDFRIDDDQPVKFRGGGVMGPDRLSLVWP
jgi:cytochrome P450